MRSPAGNLSVTELRRQRMSWRQLTITGSLRGRMAPICSGAERASESCRNKRRRTLAVADALGLVKRRRQLWDFVVIYLCCWSETIQRYILWVCVAIRCLYGRIWECSDISQIQRPHILVFMDIFCINVHCTLLHLQQDVAKQWKVKYIERKEAPCICCGVCPTVVAYLGTSHCIHGDRCAVAVRPLVKSPRPLVIIV